MLSDGLVLGGGLFRNFLFTILRIGFEKPRLDLGIAGLIFSRWCVVFLDSLKRFYALTAAVLGFDVLLHLVQRQALVGGLVSSDNGGPVLDGVVREIPVELGKLSVFPGGNVGGAGGKCLSDGDGLLSVIDDVIFFIVSLSFLF